MNDIETKPIRISLPDGGHVSGLFQSPPKAQACYVFAHGAGAGTNHAFMAAVAEGLSERGIATLRYHFHTWKKVRSVRIHRSLLTPPFALQWSKSRGLRPSCRYLPAANHLGEE